MDVTQRQERFLAVFQASYPAVLRYARRRVVDDVAPDVASEVFLVAWRRLDELPADPLPWLYGVARRVVANQRRGAERAAKLAQRVAASTAPALRHDEAGRDPGELVTGRASIAAAFYRLPPDAREVLALVVWEGLGARGLATALDCSVPAATMRLHRAKQRLRAYLAEKEN